MQSLDLFSELFDARTEADWCASVFRMGESLGFQQVLYALVPQQGQRLEDAFLRSSYAPEWRQTYDRTGLHHVDPTVAHCVARNTPLFWSPDIFVTPAQKAMYEEACFYGIRAGVTLPIHGPKGELGIVCFVNDANPAGRDRKELLRRLPHLALLRDFCFESSLRFATANPDGETLPSLTPRERECLHWAANGKSSWEIARILICSEAVVNFHMTNARRKLDVTTRREAVVKALRLGLLQL
ncbi:MAG: LuxR family transcriptional regulator [Pseudomonadota bacterium]